MHIPTRILLLLSIGLVAVLSPSPAAALSCAPWSCVCGDRAGDPDMVTSTVLEGRVIEVPGVAVVEVEAVHGAPTESWDVGSLVEQNVGPLEVEVGDRVLVNVSPESDLRSERPTWLQLLDETGAPVCHDGPLPLTTREAIDAALDEDCLATLQEYEAELSYPCGSQSGCTSASGGTSAVAVLLFALAVAVRRRVRG